MKSRINSECLLKCTKISLVSYWPRAQHFRVWNICKSLMSYLGDGLHVEFMIVGGKYTLNLVWLLSLISHRSKWPTTDGILMPKKKKWILKHFTFQVRDCQLVQRIS